MGLRELYGGAARRRTLTVASVSAVAGSLTGAIIGGLGSAGATTTPTLLHRGATAQHKTHHKASPTPSLVIPTTASFSASPSHSPSATPTPTATTTTAAPTKQTTSPPTTTTSPAATSTSPAPTPTPSASTGGSAPPATDPAPSG